MTVVHGWLHTQAGALHHWTVSLCKLPSHNTFSLYHKLFYFVLLFPNFPFCILTKQIFPNHILFPLCDLTLNQWAVAFYFKLNSVLWLSYWWKLRFSKFIKVLGFVVLKIVLTQKDHWALSKWAMLCFPFLWQLQEGLLAWELTKQTMKTVPAAETQTTLTKK